MMNSQNSKSSSNAYEWRGFMLDCVRHFMPIHFIKEVLDNMARVNMNRFHWHLTDDQGWRLPVKNRPLLTEKASSRIDGDLIIDGYYSADEITEIVNYAEKLNIVVVPEIDIPGHVCAALYAYPELSCPNHETRIPNDWGIFDDVLCAGSSAVAPFLKDVFETVLELFPSPWIHIGGDEVKDDRWKSCSKCQEVIRDNKYASEKDLYSHILSPICKLIRDHGRQVIAWDEMLESCPEEDVIIMSWRGEEGAQAASAKNRQSILCPHEHFYLDYPNSKNDILPGADWMPTLPIEKIQAYKIPDLNGIIGLQCNLWTEQVFSADDARHRLLPRLDAVAAKCFEKPIKETVLSV
ncbi:family 20 glycosylhydrolase [Lentisphaera profundi]|uniref:beta-N-acetylhexosaminidase n=1 Tax=Lentisphaera profundi TaxID=1658616 RepID=A0ABY7VUG7_9BACT|nr:family 20 glycosylhydrolase [Lentisphaera profundi]WDE95758.1 family 20 glycosylhydrolase [Lentisphaera profundi]